MRLNCSIGIMAWNEERNIGRLLELLAEQKLERVRITEIIVVASGCADGTVEVVRAKAAENPIITLIEEERRAGKASAINLFLSRARNEICVLQGADTLPGPETIERLVLPFEDARTGMTGGRPVPLNPADTFAGYTVQLLWRIHHEVSMLQPKCGELVAFRRVFESIPADTIVDEPRIEALVRAAGYLTVYAPEAVAYNLGPATVREIIMRRRSIVRGYLLLSRETHFRTSTQARKIVIAVTVKRMLSGEEPFLRALGAMGIEAVSRLLGRMDYHFSREPGHVWPAAASTKCPADFM